MAVAVMLLVLLRGATDEPKKAATANPLLSPRVAISFLNRTGDQWTELLKASSGTGIYISPTNSESDEIVKRLEMTFTAQFMRIPLAGALYWTLKLLGLECIPRDDHLELVLNGGMDLLHAWDVDAADAEIVQTLDRPFLAAHPSNLETMPFLIAYGRLEKERMPSFIVHPSVKADVARIPLVERTEAVSIGQVLRLSLAPYGLEYRVEDGVVLIVPGGKLIPLESPRTKAR